MNRIQSVVEFMQLLLQVLLLPELVVEEQLLARASSMHPAA